MFRNILSLVLILIATSAYCQTIKVVPETTKIKGESAEGFEIELDGTMGEVETQLMRYLKPVGKPKKIEYAYSISLPLINGKNYTSPLYAVVRDKGKGTAWLGIRPSEWPANKDEVSKDIEKLVYDFSVSFYRAKIQEQIDESTRALQAVEKQQQRLVNQNKDLGSKLDDNKREKIQLEKSLENNGIEFQSLNKKIAQNKKDQDSVAVAAEQIKKVIDMQKEKQAKVN